MMKGMLLTGVALFALYGQAGWAENSSSEVRPGNFFNVSTYVDTLTITTATPDWTYPKAGLKILTPGYTVSGQNADNSGFYLFSVSDKVPATISLSGEPGPVSIKLCLNGSGNGVSCELQTVDLTRQRHAYTASGFNNVVYKCRANVNGTLDQCVPSPVTGAPDWTPEAIAFAAFSGVDYAYVASWPDGIVYQCTLKADRAFDVCSALTPAGTDVYTYASGITFGTVNGTQYAYVSDDVAQVYQCGLNANGSFNTCRFATATEAPAWIPVSTTFATVNGTQRVYVASDNGNVYLCDLLSSGLFNACTVTTPVSGAPDWLPKAVTFATFSGNQYAYVADDSGQVFQCNLNTDGSLNECLATPEAGTPDWSPRAVSFETFGGVQYAYVTDFGTATSLYGDIFQCTLNAEGRFTSCEPTPAFQIPNWGNLWWTAFH